MNLPEMTVVCETCKGTGKTPDEKQFIGWKYWSTYWCPDCRGSGHMKECPNCHDANSCGDYQGPTCEVCLGEGKVPECDHIPKKAALDDEIGCIRCGQWLGKAN